MNDVNQPWLTGLGRKGTPESFRPEDWLPKDVGDLSDHQMALPRIARTPELVAKIERELPLIPTRHRLFNADARHLDFIPARSVHLVVTSPPYWTLKDYREHPGQLGHVGDYETFLRELDRVWAECFRVLVPGGRLVCVVGDVCLSRRKNKGEHTVIPLHASIQEHCRALGFSNLAPIVWHKIANANYESEGNGGGFLGKPYEPNAVIKNDIEFILMERKKGYRSPSVATRVLSVISTTRYQQWFQQIWTGVTGASTRQHPAPYPLELAERLVRMFSFVGDTVLDPFMGTGTTSIAAGKWGRNSIGVEVDPEYFRLSESRIGQELGQSESAVVECSTRQENETGGNECSTSTVNLEKQSAFSGKPAIDNKRFRAEIAGTKTLEHAQP
ncbi:MAG: site-specific DNA-methyltransferase [Azoarcus sp.]|jgi:DNA modification methylase|nr:site-specific DNA-methyltransferase [Azoarcus sp.]